MPTVTSQNRITGPNRDTAREISFAQAYGLEAEISVINENDKDWNWETSELRFKTGKGNYILKEFFKSGDDNSTDYVMLTTPFGSKKFQSFISAELFLVQLLSEGQNG